MPSFAHLASSFVRLAAALSVLVTAAPLAAQTSSSVVGRVLDQTGAVLPGATVTMRQADTGFRRTTTADEAGRYAFPTMPVGEYELSAELDGFAPASRPIVVTVAETVAADLTLAVRTQLTVIAEGAEQGVNVSTPELSYLVGARAIEQLPLNGRNYTDLALLQPGVVAFPHRDGGSVVAHGLGMSVNGQDPRSNVYLLDGTLQNDFTNGPAGSAAGTTLGVETIREFRVQANAYSAEFGRNSGGQINVITRSGSNRVAGSAYEFHRNDAFDARNFFDPPDQPDFWRHQFGATVGGPLRTDRLFFFGGYEGLREKLGRTISTFVPDENARRGLLPGPGGQLVPVAVSPVVAPYLAEFPRSNGAVLGGGIAEFTFPFAQRVEQHFAQGRVDWQRTPADKWFARYTFDDAEQQLPTDYPQFPRAFVSRNQFLTLEGIQVLGPRTVNTVRAGFSRTRIGQDVEANTAAALTPFVPGRPFLGNIDIGGLNRFGPQTSADVQLVQNVFSVQDDLAHARGAHLLKAGVLVERYQDNMVNPTFSLGIFAFPNLRTFMENRPIRFVGLRPEGQFDRYWRFTLVGLYAQDEWRVTPRLTVNGGLRYEFTTMPQDIYGRDSALINLTDREPTPGRLYRNPTYDNISPRVGLAWDPWGDGRSSVRGGYGVYYNTNNQQNLIVTVTNPPATPRVIIPNPTFPVPPFERGIGNSIRPVQYDLKTPRVHVWNVSYQRELPFSVVGLVSYAGSRGRHLLRSSDVNTAIPVRLADGTVFFPAGSPRINPAFSTIELKSSDGDSWYRALIVDLRRRWQNGLAVQSSYTWSRSVDTTQASTFFSDATNGTTSAFPEFIPDYNRGRADFDATHNWVVNFTWDLPEGGGDGPLAWATRGWQLAGIWQMRSGSPLTVFVQSNRSRSLWSPSLGPGIGQDRPSYAPGRSAKDAVRGRPDGWFDPTAFVLQPAGTFGNTGRGDFTGPDLRTLDLALTKAAGWDWLGPLGRLELRVEVFNVFNRANFGPPTLTAFAGQADNEAPLATFGRIRSTVTSARQVQLGVRVVF